MKFLTLDVTLTIAATPRQLKISVPDKKTNPDVLLPLLRKLHQMAEDLAVKEVVAKGGKISCTKGCGVCCRQLVPITQWEARYLVAMVRRMPKARKQIYKVRFRDAYRKLEDAHLIERLMDHRLIGENVIQFGLDYFRLGISCPFLEDESCSIHTERPLRCREYLVTNPAAECSRPGKENIQRVNIPGSLSKFLAELLSPWTKYPQKWVPLSIIFDWVERHPEIAAKRHSKEWIEDALTGLSKQKPTGEQLF